jgi:GrpB-like predicted nucleotidyltransferase (UPF0157 family)
MSKKIIAIVDYDAAWGLSFQREARRLQAALGDCVVAVHHIGSTAVPGLAAKPVIDVLLEVSSLAALDARESDIVALGYKTKGENGIPGRRYYHLGDRIRTHQAHAYARGNPHLRRHLAFRDYLRRHPQVAADYAQVKRDAAAACNGDSEIYCGLKDCFVKHHECLALAEGFVGLGT